jgi:hypothetical protein
MTRSAREDQAHGEAQGHLAGIAFAASVGMVSERFLETIAFAIVLGPVTLAFMVAASIVFLSSRWTRRNEATVTGTPDERGGGHGDGSQSAADPPVSRGRRAA